MSVKAIYINPDRPLPHAQTEQSKLAKCFGFALISRIGQCCR